MAPQDIPDVLASGCRHLGFTGADWVREKQTTLVKLLDTGFDAVELVLAAPTALLTGGSLPCRELVMATKYPRIGDQWIRYHGRGDRILPVSGAAEGYPPDDADYVLDVRSTGETLRAHGLRSFDTVMASSTGLYAGNGVLQDPSRQALVRLLVNEMARLLEFR
jgi:ATP phosphoribosyltransferase